LLCALIVAGTVVRIREPFMHNPLDQLFSDPGRHWAHAREPLTPGPWAIIDPPVYQILLSVVQKWSLGLPPLVATYEGALSAVTPWLWYRYLRETLRSRTLALVGWGILAWLPSWIAIYGYLMTETLFLTLMGASLWQTMRARRLGTVSSFCGMVALWVLTGMTRGIAVPLGGLAGLWVWMKHPHKVRTVGASILIVLSMTVPFAIRNYHYLHLWTPFGTGWPNQVYAGSGRRTIHLDLVSEIGGWAYEFGSPSLYGKPLAPLSDWESKRTGTVKISVDFRKGADDWRSADEANAAHGSERLWLRWENLILLMFGPSWPDNNPEFLVARLADAMRWVWAPLFVAVVVASAIRYRTSLARPLMPVLIVTWFAFQGVTLLVVNEGRYRKPLEGMLVAQVLILLDRTRPPGRRVVASG
jgi:hypothetical protein